MKLRLASALLLASLVQGRADAPISTLPVQPSISGQEYVLGIVPSGLGGYITKRISTSLLLPPAQALSAGSITSLPYGTPPTFSITGSVPNQVLNLGIPAGATGAMGPAGPMGATGATGATGAQGPAGAGNVNTVGTPAAGNVAYYAGTNGAQITPGGLSNIGAASRGSNADITALTGLTTAVPISEGGTGQTAASAALSALGGAPLASPALTGTPTVPTAAPGTNTTQAASTGFVAAAISAAPAGNGAPSANNAQSANYTIVSGDKGKTLLLTGTFTLTSPTASNGFYFYVQKRDGSGVVTFTPASGTIDGRSTIAIYQEAFLIWSDGTNWFTQNRPRGWIDMGTTVVSSAVASVLINTGLGDTELREVEVDFNNLVTASSASVIMRVSKGGVVQSTNYVSSLLYVNTGSTAGAVGTGTAAGFFNSEASGPSGQMGTINVANPVSTTVTAQRVKFQGTNGSSGLGYVTGEGYNSNAGAVDGVAFVASTGNISSGTFNEKGFRN